MVSDAEDGLRRMNPVVDRYITTDVPMGVLVQATPVPRSPLMDAILAIHDCLEGRLLAKEAIDRAAAVNIHSADPELLILFVSSWAELECRMAMPSEAAALIHKGRSLADDSVHPEIRAALDLADATLADATGNKVGAEKLMRGILDYVSPHSPRRKFYTWELALFLSLQGRASEFDESLRDLSWRCNERLPLAKVQLVMFIDAMETGRPRDAAHLMTGIAATPQILRDLKRVGYRGYQFLLRLMRSAPGSIPEPGASDPEWCGVVQALLIPDPRKALDLARAEAGRKLAALFQSGFPSCNMIRAELANGAWEGAQRLLGMRRSRGNTHYMDDLFLARAELLAGNRHSARRHFSRLLEEVNSRNAKGRLDFELRLSCELSHGDIVFLSQSRPARPAQSPEPVIPEHPESTKERRNALRQIIGRSEAIHQVRETIVRFAPLDAPVLIVGETGTGKELVARALHDVSRRRNESFIAVNCGAITDTLLESELFGHERGSFTGADKASKGIFEDAGEGTVFLDEIGSISPRLQGALLRVLETGEARAVGSPRSRTVRCRILAATNVELDQLVSRGGFRSDLLFRLRRLEIAVPPLRERKDDIPLLVRHFMDAGRPVGQHATVTRPLETLLKRYDWPGNIRELRNVIERMRLLHSDKALYDVPDLDTKLTHQQEAPPVQPGDQRDTPARAFAATDAEPARPIETASRPPHRAETAQGAPAKSGDGRSDVEAVLAAGRSAVRRTERLKALFDRHERLTRSEIMQIMRVSPNTATKDLKTLCDEGYIRRVEPSASSRSYYFERVEACQA
jgi:DNA-binding NtrC family response regulator